MWRGICIVDAFIYLLFANRYRDRFWRETVFTGIAGIRKALDESYGPGQVSMVSAVFRWMNHHSKMKKEYGGVAS